MCVTYIHCTDKCMRARVVNSPAKCIKCPNEFIMNVMYIVCFVDKCVVLACIGVYALNNMHFCVHAVLSRQAVDHVYSSQLIIFLSNNASASL